MTSVIVLRKTGSVHPSATAAEVSAALLLVIPSELRISYYAALINGNVCGFL
jgi:hypothetical protein